MNKQRDVRKHIAAAKGWLKRADDSLEQDNDIQGDLKLMLAQAELQRAQEKNAQKACVRWFKRLAAPIVACLLALGGILYMQWGRQEQEMPRQMPEAATVQPEAVPVEQPPAGQDEAPADGSPLSVPVAVEPQAEAKNIEANEVENQAAKQDMSEQSQQEPQVPAGELQKLMQSAGSILRE